MPGKSASAAPTLSAEDLAKALDVKPPSDPQALEDHVEQLLMRAQVSWLSKRDVLDILTNWQVYNLPISLMPPDQPGPGSLFLFDRTQLKSFRRDNHIWKSKAGGKTVQETHEKLKIEGGIPALNCYYAHSADGTLQRRCYWKLAGTPNIVLMHYRSPSNGKRTDRSSPPAAATPLTVEGRHPSAPGYLPPPDPAQQAHADVSGHHALPNLPQPVSDAAMPRAAPQLPHVLGVDHDSARAHGDAVAAVPPMLASVPQLPLQPLPADALTSMVSMGGDPLARWPSTDWFSGHSNMAHPGSWPGGIGPEGTFSHAQLPSDPTSLLPPACTSQSGLAPTFSDLEAAAGLQPQPPVGVPAQHNGASISGMSFSKTEEKPADMIPPPPGHPEVPQAEEVEPPPGHVNVSHVAMPACPPKVEHTNGSDQARFSAAVADTNEAHGLKRSPEDIESEPLADKKARTDVHTD